MTKIIPIGVEGNPCPYDRHGSVILVEYSDYKTRNIKCTSTNNNFFRFSKRCPYNIGRYCRG